MRPSPSLSLPSEHSLEPSSSSSLLEHVVLAVEALGVVALEGGGGREATRGIRGRQPRARGAARPVEFGGALAGDDAGRIVGVDQAVVIVVEAVGALDPRAVASQAHDRERDGGMGERERPNRTGA
jgi:hypothetical protein